MTVIPSKIGAIAKGLNRHRFYFILINTIAVAVMLFSAPVSWNIYDIRYFEEWATIANRYNILYIYKYATKAAYPPVPIITFVSLYDLAIFLGGEELNPALARLLTKLPLIISFVLIGYILYRHYGWKTARWWYLSYASYSTIFSYQFDLLVALFLLLSYVFMFEKKSMILSGVMFSLAVLTKPLPIVVLPLIIIFYAGEGKKRELYEFLYGSFITGIVVTLPFFIISPYDFLSKAILFHSYRLPQELSPYALPLYFSKYHYNTLPEWIPVLWLPVFIALYITVLAYLIKGRYLRKCLLLSISIVLLLSIAINKVGNNPYYIWVLPFLSIILEEMRRDIDNKFIVAYLIAPIISMLVYPFFTLFTAAVVDGYVFIVEDLKFYNAFDLFTESFRGAPYFNGYQWVMFCRTYLFPLFSMLYKYMWLTAAITAVVYTIFLLYMILKMTMIYSNKCSIR
ncbi:MAG: hypothetical protein J7K21_00060 [Desulfurococcales archaeon]|nr:hypothetical protein [Desulfurococcales archaeon]